MSIRIVKYDETSFWRQDIAARAGKIESFYLVDTEKETFCCEIRPSYLLHFLYNRIENHQAFTEDELTEHEQNNGDTPAMYVHTTSVFDVVKDGIEPSREFDEYDEFMEHLIENERCNPSF